MITIFTILLLVMIFKLTVWVIRICGKLVGGIIGFIGSLLIAAFILAGIGMTIAFVPVIIVGALVAGAFGIIARVAN